MGGLRVPGELGADLPDTVTQGDDPVEALTEQIVEVGRLPARDVDAVLPHRSDGVGMEGFGVAAGAAGVDGPARSDPGEGLGHL